MEDESLTVENTDFAEIESYAIDDKDCDEIDDRLGNDLQTNVISGNFKGLDGVRFYDEDDDEEEEELRHLFLPADGTTEQAVVPLGNRQEDDEGEIGSDEEQDILQGIRDDIELKVRGEMEEELRGYQERMKAIEEGYLPGRTDDEKNNAASIDENDEMSPQLREAIIKMNKLDKILRKKVKREKEVKRERIILERRMRQEISEMEQGASKIREIRMNTEKFLALAPPPSHNEGISIESEDEEEMPPLFQTQFDESELNRQKIKRTNNKNGQNAGNELSRSGSSISSQGNKSQASTSGINMSQSKKKTKKKDFIKRNKELAGEADQPVAMTDDEKRRLQSLLEGVDDLPELEDGEDISSLMETNPFQLTLQPGEGFCPDVSESRTLSSIDQRLKGLMPEEDFKFIFNKGSGYAQGTESVVDTPPQRLFTRVGINSTGNDTAALDRFGERVLYETKEERELKARLLAIESQLEQFKIPKEMEDQPAEDYHLTDQQLDELLDQCARNMGHTIEADTPGSTPRSQLSSRQSLMANPPKLTDEQLQQLLSDAQFPLSSRLLALRDDDQKLEEEDGSTEMIRAETWIAIRDAKLDENIGEVEGAQAVGFSEQSGTDKTKHLETKSINSLLNSCTTKVIQESSKFGNEISLQQGNLSTNNAHQNDIAGASLKADFPEGREIDDFAFTPDITNPVYTGDGLSSWYGNCNSSEANQDRDTVARGGSGGARPKYGSAVGLPKLNPVQFSSSSTSLRESAEYDSNGRAGSSSLVSSSRESFDSSFPSNNNNNGSQDGVQHSVRLPDISPNSFLIHTPQGMNNSEKKQPRQSLPSRPPLNMVRNNLSDMSVTSLSASDQDNTTPIMQLNQTSSVGQNSATSSPGQRVPQYTQMKQPTPPSLKKQS